MDDRSGHRRCIPSGRPVARTAYGHLPQGCNDLSGVYWHWIGRSRRNERKECTMRKFSPARIRLFVQIIYTILTNGYVYGYLNGKIYKGPLKYACVPGLNCYSCPGAIGSCPMGALQAALNGRNLKIPFAVLGFFFIFGSLLGRFVCGWLCPFGLVQDLLYKIPFFKKRRQLPGHNVFKYGKYVVLFGLVLVGSAFLFTGFAKVPAFCKFLCPSGTLFGAIPLVGANEQLQTQIGGLFYWKMAVLFVITFF